MSALHGPMRGSCGCGVCVVAELRARFASRRQSVHAERERQLAEGAGVAPALLVVRDVWDEALELLDDVAAGAHVEREPLNCERPPAVVTTWREIAGDWYRHVDDGGEEPRQVAHVYPSRVARGWWDWRVFPARGDSIAPTDIARSLREARRGADEALRKRGFSVPPVDGGTEAKS